MEDPRTFKEWKRDYNRKRDKADRIRENLSEDCCLHAIQYDKIPDTPDRYRDRTLEKISRQDQDREELEKLEVECTGIYIDMCLRLQRAVYAHTDLRADDMKAVKLCMVDGYSIELAEQESGISSRDLKKAIGKAKKAITHYEQRMGL